MSKYKQLKEEKYVTIMSILKDPKEVIDTLNELEKSEDIDSIYFLPYCDFLIGMILANYTFDKESVIAFYEIYSKTLECNISSLKYALQQLKQSLSDYFKELKSKF